MNNEYTEKIKQEMRDFKQYYYTEREASEKNLIKCSCGIQPHLASYIFDHILGFNVEYRPLEKINYEIQFKYKEKLGGLYHHKLSYNLYLEEEIKNEVLDILNNTNKLFEKALLEYSKEAIKINNYSLPNYYNEYLYKLCIIEKNIERINNKMKSKEELKKRDIQELIKNGTINNYEEKDFGTYKVTYYYKDSIYEKYNKIIEQLREEMSYTIEVYIDTLFSLMEHFFSLLYPMTSKYQENENFSEYLGYDWRRKIEKMSNKYEMELGELSRIKDMYRNRYAHGFFSKEKEIHIQIPNCGMFPLWIGKEYCQGYAGPSNKLTYENYKETKEIFEAFMQRIKEDYKLQYIIIISNIPTFLKKAIYREAFTNDKNNEYWIEGYWYMQDNILNMDW